MNTNYSSIHSHEAFIGDYQVMYTPGSTSPQFDRAKKSTRFSRAVSSKSQNPSQSFMLPPNIPNTSQIVADHGSLPNVQIHYTVPADEKQIVASLRTLQRDLNEAMQTINSLTRERDEALFELRLLRAASKKQNTPPRKSRAASRVEEELFDISRSMSSPQKSPIRRTSKKETSADTKEAPKTTNSDDARVLSGVINRPMSPASEMRPTRSDATAKSKTQSYQRPTVNDTENSVIEDPTAASNTSRRRRRPSLDENMTSAYILPDITVSQPPRSARIQVSQEAQSVLHRHGDPEHIENCTVCRRLTARKPRQINHATRSASALAAEKTDFTAQITQLMKDAMLEEPTLRPKINPWHALANVKKLLMDQFEEAKRKHAQAWEKYDAIEAPSNSKKHSAASQDLFNWSKKMEECRVNLDQLRDVEEGMKEQESGV
ncbi:uncharacterized protein A1O5_11858 [Cladophialophora psammophila CBS 110553]|uniref:Cep57 centrosome microtubule-binding domain-containing protein n=1 Tax=Cladophialophora psammophila CBS 110553 TaxID=1182543 RepID=W9W9T9_9EURO|nr:uncharacterized protein A1O5_11858 [Cladophialophora psammophila CBS 110553]EXJ61301.1 hypothetical protein A1O5_11858 [Cladophialophora psammophila CBS 110553]